MKYITPIRVRKSRKNKNEFQNENEDYELPTNNIMSLNEDDENNKERRNEFTLNNGNPILNLNNSYINNRIEETPSFQNNNFINLPSQYQTIIDNESKDKINKENNIFFSVLRNENNMLNNSISNLNSHQRTNCESTDIKNNNSTTII